MNTAYEQTFDNYSVADVSPEERASFIRKTYLHLAGAILAFIVIEAFLMTSGAAYVLTKTMLSTQWSWLIVLGAFMGVSMLAQWWANSQTSKAMQYAGLGLFAVAEAIIFAPLLFIAQAQAGGGVILEAGVVAIGLFLGITAVVFLTKKDFSFLGPILGIAGFIALGAIFSAVIFGFSLGTFFAWIMVAFAGGTILYNTSNVLHHYRPGQHVAAALTLFASVALLFWYILRIFMGSRD
jgi:FtsH-binding integral membrane protein